MEVPSSSSRNNWNTVTVDGGWCGLAWSREGLVRCTLPRSDREAAADATASSAGRQGTDDLFDEAARLLKAYYRGERVVFDLPLAPEGMTPFAERVLAACARIDYGQIRTYGEVAEAAGSPRAARAVGQALAANPLLVVIPCHRVVGTGGDLVGFRGGTDWKKHLLEMEGVDLRTCMIDR